MFSLLMVSHFPDALSQDISTLSNPGFTQMLPITPSFFSAQARQFALLGNAAAAEGVGVMRSTCPGIEGPKV